jgi:hypothetical protein
VIIHFYILLYVLYTHKVRRFCESFVALIIGKWIIAVINRWIGLYNDDIMGVNVE